MIRSGITCSVSTCTFTAISLISCQDINNKCADHVGDEHSGDRMEPRKWSTLSKCQAWDRKECILVSWAEYKNDLKAPTCSHPHEDVDAVARLESFRALTLSRLESFRVLNSHRQIREF